MGRDDVNRRDGGKANVERIGQRCRYLPLPGKGPERRRAATQVTPATAERDLDIVAALGRAFRHINMGVYAEVVAGGEIALGDPLLSGR